MVLTGETEVLGEKHYTAWVVDGWMSMEQYCVDSRQLAAHRATTSSSHATFKNLLFLGPPSYFEIVFYRMSNLCSGNKMFPK
jgi:hypothetical protein